MTAASGDVEYNSFSKISRYTTLGDGLTRVAIVKALFHNNNNNNNNKLWPTQYRWYLWVYMSKSSHQVYNIRIPVRKRTSVSIVLFITRLLFWPTKNTDYATIINESFFFSFSFVILFLCFSLECGASMSFTRRDVALPPPIQWWRPPARSVAVAVVRWAARSAGTTRSWRPAGTATSRDPAWALAAGPWSPVGPDAARTAGNTAATWPCAATTTARRRRPLPRTFRYASSAWSATDCTLKTERNNKITRAFAIRDEDFEENLRTGEKLCRRICNEDQWRVRRVIVR